tara:strand:+ start:46 stop:516 length:471 start_codon:yes stop_codon:yes gene_type:complete
MKPINNEDKQKWCEYGEETEKDFIDSFSNDQVSVSLNPDKVTDKFTHDFIITLPADLKTVRTRFRTSGRYGVPSTSAITLNKKDVDRYGELYPNIIIIFDIDYGDYKKTCYVTLSSIKNIIAEGKAKLHYYNSRVNDSNNAQCSYVLDAEWFEDVL